MEETRKQVAAVVIVATPAPEALQALGTGRATLLLRSRHAVDENLKAVAIGAHDLPSAWVDVTNSR